MDIDADGDLDVAVVNNGMVSLLTARGDGQFTRTGLSTGGTPLRIVPGDVDGDGDADFVVPDGSVRELIVLLNGGGLGFFELRQALTGFPEDVSLGDFDGDGLLDAAVYETDGAVRTVTLRPGNGDGTFGAPSSSIALGRDVTAMRTSDLDGDGALDLVLGQAWSPGVLALLGRGDGTFLPSLASPDQEFVAPSDLELRDANGDGLPDLYLVNASGGVRVGLGTGTGVFVPSQVAWGAGATLAVGDVTGDGLPDVVSGRDDLRLLEGRPDGALAGSRVIATAQDLDMPFLGDFDGDGDLDVGGIRGDPTLGPRAAVVAENLGSGWFTTRARRSTEGIEPNMVAVGDVDGDGFSDAVVANTLYAGGISVLLADGAGGFLPPVHYTANSPTSLVLADRNGDGILDVFSQFSRGVELLRGLGGGAFGAPQQVSPSYSIGARHPSVALGDMNNDGSPDLVTANSKKNPGSVDVQLANAPWTFGTPTSHRLPYERPIGLELADLNADGDPDVVAINGAASQSLEVFLGLGDGSLESPVTYDLPRPRSLAVGDLDGDAHLDLVTADASGGFHVLLGQGDGTFDAPVPHSLAGQASERIRLGDVDADGALDVIVTLQVARWAVAVARGRGDGSFEPATSFAAGELGDGFDFGDIDGDGAIDLFVLDRDRSQKQVLAIINQLPSR